MIVKNEFKTDQGKNITVRNISFDSLEDLRKNMGKFIAESRQEDSSNFEINEEGIYLFRSLHDKTKALRIYKDFNLYEYVYHDDYKIVSKLQEKQENIKLSKFPTGIITVENKIIGQEIPLYDNSKTIFEYFKDGKMKKRPTQFYLEILNILKELCNNDIIYRDVHKRNFLVDNITEIINIIDFESAFLSFENLSYNYESMINNFKTYLINVLNSVCNIKFGDDFKRANTLEELEEVILEEDYKLKVK